MTLSLPYQGSSTKVYTVNAGADAAPDWLAKRGAKKGKSRASERDADGGPSGLRLIQDLDFPEASNRIKSSRDGRYILATGTYKPRMKVFELDELAMKFERTTDAENVDFEVLSDDWTKTLHLQADRSVEVHNQASAFYRTRIPKAGRCIAYHYPSCDALVGGLGGHVNRLNLEQGRFLNPFAMQGNSEDGEGTDGDGDVVTGVNAIDISPAHNLLAFGTETALGQGTIELWDHRSRKRAALLRLPYAKLSMSTSSVAAPLPGLEADGPNNSSKGISVTALASRIDGLNLAVGTSTGHTLLYDLRAARPYATKDQGYGLPIKKLSWVTGFSSDAPSVASADSKVVKIWSSADASANHVAVTPQAPINDMHIHQDTGLVFLANEQSAMMAYYIPQMGPAPRWCRFLDNMTEEMEDNTGASLYEDYKFIDRKELSALNMEHLLGTPQLKPYMHGFFVDLRTYTKARAIANPFEYAEYRQKLVSERLEKERESRIRTKKGSLPSVDGVAALTASGQKVTVNKGLLARLQASADKEDRKRKRTHDQSNPADDQKDSEAARTDLLQDSRFDSVFTNAEFAIDEKSREFALLNPSAAAQAARRRTEDVEEDDGDVIEAEDSQAEESDSSAEGDLAPYIPKTKRARDIETIRPGNQRSNGPKMTMDFGDSRQRQQLPKDTALGKVSGRRGRAVPRSQMRQEQSYGHNLGAGNKEFSFTPSNTSSSEHRDKKRAKVHAEKAKKAEFGVGLSRDHAIQENTFEGDSRAGRQQRRRVDRSASNGAIRKLTGSRPAMQRRR